VLLIVIAIAGVEKDETYFLWADSLKVNHKLTYTSP